MGNHQNRPIDTTSEEVYSLGVTLLVFAICVRGSSGDVTGCNQEDPA
jgi:hypothetical protein